MERLIGLLGIVALLAIAVLFSSNRRWIRPRVVIPAFLLQAGFALLVLGTPWGRAIIQAMSSAVGMEAAIWLPNRAAILTTRSRGMPVCSIMCSSASGLA